ncbi:MAG: type II secretion system F family protein [Butyrivibrio sp.]|nr:type II secretion system F family protein [Butyrivibrio sp.]
MNVIIYVLVALMLILLLFLSRNIKVKGQSGVIKTRYRKMAVYIYDFLEEKEILKKKDLARLSMQRLYPNKKPEEATRNYYIEKIELVLYLITAGCFLSIVAFATSHNDALTSNEYGTYLERNDYGEGSKREYIQASESGNKIAKFEIELEERRYTKSEAEKLYVEAAKIIGKRILKDNSSLDEVSSDLDLIDSLEGYPFEIIWKSSDTNRIHSDGTLEMEGIYELPEEGVCTVLLATFKYYDYSWIQSIPIRIVSPEESEIEKLTRKLNESLAYQQSESIYDEVMYLPETDESGEHVLNWSRHIKDNSIYIFVLTMAAAIVIYISKDRDLRSDVEERRRQMLRKYPQFISQMVLYLGAGMTVRNIFQKLSKDSYEYGKKTDYLSAEIKRTVYEMNSGISEQDAYENFADRCGLQQYTRFATLLSQNLRKGNSELLNLLHEESVKAYEERMDLARKMGEEAGTKLLVPMFMMLLVVMIVIMIPALISF